MDLSPTRELAQVGSNLNPLASYTTVYHLTPKIMHKGAFCLMSYTFRKKKTNWLEILIFPALLILFYVLEIFYLKPVDGINDDWGMYSTLSGAYTGTPDAHVLFFLYPLSFLLCQLYRLCSFIPWFSLFQHGVQILSLYCVYKRYLSLRRKHHPDSSCVFPGCMLFLFLFMVADLNVLSEAQYTTTAGVAAAAALFCFTTSGMRQPMSIFLRQNIPTFVLSFIAFSMRQNIFYLMLPMAGMLWLAKLVIGRREGCEKVLLRLFVFAGILLLGMGILFGLHKLAYREQPWADFVKINHYRERVGDFYTWPEYEECADQLKELGLDEIEYSRLKNGAPYIGYGMDLDDWKAMHDIARECYLNRTDLSSRLKNIPIGSVKAFFYQEGMQPLNLLVGVLLVLTLFLILWQANYTALFVYLCYLFGRTVSWAYVLYEGRFPKRIIQPLMLTDLMILGGILVAFHLLPFGKKRFQTVMVPVILVLSLLSLFCTKTDIDLSYHKGQAVWEGLKEYCHSHPENFYIWSYNTGTLDNYCEPAFSLSQDTYNNFFYTNWGVVCNPNSLIKLEKHGIREFGLDLADNPNVYFIFQEGLYSDEHPVIMYFRHTYQKQCAKTDSFEAGGIRYEVYQLQKTPETP